MDGCAGEIMGETASREGGKGEAWEGKRMGDMNGLSMGNRLVQDIELDDEKGRLRGGDESYGQLRREICARLSIIVSVLGHERPGG